ncbi:hypothetical protein RFI_11864 [Reticulomyxa filosa]|uniref:SAM domain-containing protein n=1 Tax=Reticulomyxa filosa TaxID=46433 RepID=X6NG24_RETFI|nr:hypothetical protein RFI_11864 [Reticulomyxa filosa]|eukprot:ETO25280.1 hypothetical protein RFI_11864 [Reticulomyxa filosa]
MSHKVGLFCSNGQKKLFREGSAKTKLSLDKTLSTPAQAFTAFEQNNQESVAEKWETFGKTLKGSNNTVTNSVGGWSSAYGSTVVSKGAIQEWVVEYHVGADDDGDFASSCGIATDTKYLDSWFQGREEWSVAIHYVFLNANQTNKQTKKIFFLVLINKTRFRIVLDMSTRQVSFFYPWDTKAPVHVHSNLPEDSHFRLACSLFSKNTTFVVMSSKSSGQQQSYWKAMDSLNTMLADVSKSSHDLETLQVKDNVKDLQEMKRDLGKFQEQFLEKWSLLQQQVSKWQKSISTVSAHIDAQLKPATDKYQEWTLTDVVKWICYLENGRFLLYADTLSQALRKVDFSGKNLDSLKEDDLSTFGVTNLKDSTDLFAHVLILTGKKSVSQEK